MLAVNNIVKVVCELEVILAVVVDELDRRTRMGVVLTREHIGNVISPFYALLTQSVHMLLDKLDDRVDLILWVFEEAEQKLKRTVAGASAHSVYGCVKIACAVSHGVDGIGKSELLIVVRVDARELAVLFGDLAVHLISA